MEAVDFLLCQRCGRIWRSMLWFQILPWFLRYFDLCKDDRLSVFGFLSEIGLRWGLIGTGTGIGTTGKFIKTMQPFGPLCHQMTCKQSPHKTTNACVRGCNTCNILRRRVDSPIPLYTGIIKAKIHPAPLGLVRTPSVKNMGWFRIVVPLTYALGVP